MTGKPNIDDLNFTEFQSCQPKESFVKEGESIESGAVNLWENCLSSAPDRSFVQIQFNSQNFVDFFKDRCCPPSQQKFDSVDKRYF